MRPATITPTFVTMMMKLPKKKVLKCLWLMKYLDIGLLRPATLPQVITEVVYIGILIPATLPLVILEDMIVVMLLEMDLGNKRPATVPIKIGEQ